jgi:hypothetical protein
MPLDSRVSILDCIRFDHLIDALAAVLKQHLEASNPWLANCPAGQQI